MRKIFAVALVALHAVLGTSVQAADTAKIGILLPLTGPFAAVAEKPGVSREKLARAVGAPARFVSTDRRDALRGAVDGRLAHRLVDERGEHAQRRK